MISITAVDLYMKGNYQDIQRYPEGDLAIAADAEATLPILIEAVRRLINDDRKRDAKNGKRIYMSYGCYECHGREGRGSVLTGPQPPDSKSVPLLNADPGRGKSK